MDNWNLIKLHDFANDENQVIQFLKDKNILKNEMYCDQCHVSDNLIKIKWVKYNSKFSLRQHFLFSPEMCLSKQNSDYIYDNYNVTNK